MKRLILLLSICSQVVGCGVVRTGFIDIDPRLERMTLGEGVFEFQNTGTDAIAASTSLTFSSIPVDRWPQGSQWKGGPGLRQVDYEAIVSGFLVNVLHDDISRWHVANRSYLVPCSDISSGFKAASVHMFQVGYRDGRDFRIELGVLVDPRTQYVSYLQELITGTVSAPTAIGISGRRVDAESALGVAEKSGMEEVRLRAENKCTIDVTMIGWKGNVWMVNYRFADRLREDVTVTVDAVSGAIVR